MKGLALYAWHGTEKYDEVFWLPEATSDADAKAYAFLKMAIDGRAKRIQVEGYDGIIVDIARGPTGSLILLEPSDEATPTHSPKR